MKFPISNEQLAAEYRNGAGLKQLAAKYQRSYTAIRLRLVRTGEPRRINGAPRNNQNWKGNRAQ